MPPWKGGGNPSAAHVVKYLRSYEERYELPIHRPSTVLNVERGREGGYISHTDRGTWISQAVINATGTWRRPFVPRVPGAEDFAGIHRHTSGYRSRTAFTGQRVMVVGGGNSGAQIAADLLPTAASVTWVTRRPPQYLPDGIDGRALFMLASEHVTSLHEGKSSTGGVAALGDIVAVPPVREARDAGRLQALPMFTRFTASGVAWGNAVHVDLDAVIWCTGFRPDLGHLRPMGLTMNGPVPAAHPDPPTLALDHPGMFFLGYGDWAGPASATLIGVGAPARATVQAATQGLHGSS